MVFPGVAKQSRHFGQTDIVARGRLAHGCAILATPAGFTSRIKPAGAFSLMYSGAQPCATPSCGRAFHSPNGGHSPATLPPVLGAVSFVSSTTQATKHRMPAASPRDRGDSCAVSAATASSRTRWRASFEERSWTSLDSPHFRWRTLQGLLRTPNAVERRGREQLAGGLDACKPALLRGSRKWFAQHLQHLHGRFRHLRPDAVAGKQRCSDHSGESAFHA